MNITCNCCGAEITRVSLIPGMPAEGICSVCEHRQEVDEPSMPQESLLDLISDPRVASLCVLTSVVLQFTGMTIPTRLVAETVARLSLKALDELAARGILTIDGEQLIVHGTKDFYIKKPG